jgi:hypothetical protein
MHQIQWVNSYRCNCNHNHIQSLVKQPAAALQEPLLHQTLHVVVCWATHFPTGPHAYATAPSGAHNHLPTPPSPGWPSIGPATKRCCGCCCNSQPSLYFSQQPPCTHKLNYQLTIGSSVWIIHTVQIQHKQQRLLLLLQQRSSSPHTSQQALTSPYNPASQRLVQLANQMKGSPSVIHCS